MSMIPAYTTSTFTDIYPDYTEFIKNYNDCGIPTIIKEESAKTLYLLLVARYGNSPIANNDVNQFRLKLFSIVFQYGPTWEKRLQIQQDLRDMSMDELMMGATNIYNSAVNDGGQPTTATSEELPYINQQNTNKYKRSKLDAYNVLMNLLRVDVTENLLKEFSKLFKIVVAPEQQILYEQNEDCED